jgi:uncharacterized membrane protein (UPF0127 family)
MRAVNETRGTELMASGRRATGFWDRSRGLLGRESLPPGDGLLLDPCSGIHMFFMRFPIDAVFIDRDGRVVHLSRGIGPWRMSRYVLRARAVLELPAGTIQRSRTQLGDRLLFEG